MIISPTSARPAAMIQALSAAAAIRPDTVPNSATRAKVRSPAFALGVR